MISFYRLTRPVTMLLSIAMGAIISGCDGGNRSSLNILGNDFEEAVNPDAAYSFATGHSSEQGGAYWQCDISSSLGLLRSARLKLWLDDQIGLIGNSPVNWTSSGEYLEFDTGAGSVSIGDANIHTEDGVRRLSGVSSQGEYLDCIFQGPELAGLVLDDDGSSSLESALAGGNGREWGCILEENLATTMWGPMLLQSNGTGLVGQTIVDWYIYDENILAMASYNGYTEIVDIANPVQGVFSGMMEGGILSCESAY